MRNPNEEGRAWFALLAGVPAILSWAAYGVAWIAAPRFPGLPSPIECAAGTAGFYYALVMVLLFIAGPR